MTQWLHSCRGHPSVYVLHTGSWSSLLEGSLDAGIQLPQQPLRGQEPQTITLLIHHCPLLYLECPQWTHIQYLDTIPSALAVTLLQPHIGHKGHHGPGTFSPWEGSSSAFCVDFSFVFYSLP